MLARYCIKTLSTLLSALDGKKVCLCLLPSYLGGPPTKEGFVHEVFVFLDRLCLLTEEETLFQDSYRGALVSQFSALVSG